MPGRVFHGSGMMDTPDGRYHWVGKPPLDIRVAAHPDNPTLQQAYEHLLMLLRMIEN